MNQGMHVTRIHDEYLIAESLYVHDDDVNQSSSADLAFARARGVVGLSTARENDGSNQCKQCTCTLVPSALV
jgi:hypothetical protein